MQPTWLKAIWLVSADIITSELWSPTIASGLYPDGSFWSLKSPNSLRAEVLFVLLLSPSPSPSLVLSIVYIFFLTSGFLLSRAFSLSLFLSPPFFSLSCEFSLSPSLNDTRVSLTLVQHTHVTMGTACDVPLYNHFTNFLTICTN